MTSRRLAAEFLGTAMLLVAVVGSGIVASTDGPASVQLFQHAVVVGVGLAALILTFGPVSGAHFNPAVTLVDVAFGGMSRRLAAGYVGAQVTGALVGAIGTNLMFGLTAVAASDNVRSGGTLVASEALATFGLVLLIFGMVRGGNARAVPGAVGAYIAAFIYSVPSASFANPAVTVARTVTDTYTGIAVTDAPGFIGGQLAGAGLAWLVVRWLFRSDPVDAERQTMRGRTRSSTSSASATGPP